MPAPARSGRCWRTSSPSSSHLCRRVLLPAGRSSTKGRPLPGGGVRQTRNHKPKLRTSSGSVRRSATTAARPRRTSSTSSTQRGRPSSACWKSCLCASDNLVSDVAVASCALAQMGCSAAFPTAGKVDCVTKFSRPVSQCLLAMWGDMSSLASASSMVAWISLILALSSQERAAAPPRRD